MKIRHASTLARLLPFFGPHKKRMGWAFLTLAIITGVHLLRPLVLRYIIDKAVPAGDMKSALLAASVFLAGLLLGGCASYAQVLILAKVGNEIIAGVKHKIFTHIVHQGMRFFDHHQTGSLLSRTESDTDRLGSLFTHMTANLLSVFVMLIGIIAIILWEQPGMFIYIAFLTPLLVTVLGGHLVYMRRVHTRIRARNSELTGYVTEYIQGIPLLQLYSRKEKACELLASYNKEKYREERNSLFVMHCLFWSFFNFLSESGMVIAVFLYGTTKVISGEMSVGSMVMYIELMRQFFAPLRHLIFILVELQSSLAAAGRIFEILDTPTDVPDLGRDPRAGHLDQPLEFRNIGFAYGKDQVLHNVSFRVGKGERIAIVGPSGSGKTTCINLLLRFYDPATGSITIGGEDIRNFRLSEWRSRLALVLQEVYLFPGTIMQNLKLFDDTISDERVIEAATVLGAHELICGKPAGYQTMLSERGANLSQGERQLLAFTRALVRNPDVLILNEATSSVDVITEHALQRSLHNLLKGRTALIIAHRLSTIRESDRILVFDKGQIVETGRHDELMAAGGLYHKLSMIQAVEGGQ
ncbi:MAG: ABC transporter ATP-binding protein [Candidatus Wallbacteria bacterium]|nr:ABC transporter ATP-binding protein [Candidatus Wallbacteria bacterium]